MKRSSVYGTIIMIKTTLVEVNATCFSRSSSSIKFPRRPISPNWPRYRSYRTFTCYARVTVRFQLFRMIAFARPSGRNNRAPWNCIRITGLLIIALLRNQLKLDLLSLPFLPIFRKLHRYGLQSILTYNASVSLSLKLFIANRPRNRAYASFRGIETLLLREFSMDRERRASL